MKKAFWILLLAFSLSAPAFALEERLVDRLELSRQAFHELMESNDASIPQDMLAKSQAIVIFPRTLNVAWGIGGQYGKGVALRHDPKTGAWSKPVFYSIGGLTLGPQIGGQAIDIVLVVMNEKGLASLLKSKSTLGGDAGIALGPVGRNATASTDLRAGAEIYSYSRAKGLYIGLSLKGAIVAPDKDANRQYYGTDVTPAQVLLENKGSERSEHQKLMKEIHRYAPPKASMPVLVIAGAVIALAAVLFGMKLLNKK